MLTEVKFKAVETIDDINIAIGRLEYLRDNFGNTSKILQYAKELDVGNGDSGIFGICSFMYYVMNPLAQDELWDYMIEQYLKSKEISANSVSFAFPVVGGSKLFYKSSLSEIWNDPNRLDFINIILDELNKLLLNPNQTYKYETNRWVK